MTKKERPRPLSEGSLLSDAQLSEITVGIGREALPDGCSLELLDHPVYGADVGFTLYLEYCQDRFDLTSDELLLNLWYRCERFVQLYDGVHGGYADGDHQRADRLLESVDGLDLPEDGLGSIFDQIEGEVAEILSQYTS